MAFKKSGGFGGRREGGFSRGSDKPRFERQSFSRGSTRGRNDEAPRELYTATCANCGKKCEVPFRPSGDRPVFCKDCFGEKRGNDSGEYRRPPFEKTFERKPAAPDARIDELKRQVEGMNKKLDTVVEMLAALTTAPKSKSTLAGVVKKVAKKAEKSKE